MQNIKKDGDYAKRDTDSKRNLELYEVMRVASGGTIQIRKKADTYLQKFKLETDTAFKDRASASILAPFTKNAIESSLAKIFSKETLYDEDSTFKKFDIYNNFDNNGTSFNKFIEDLTKTVLTDGISFIYVAYPYVKNPDSVSANDAIRDNIRPYASIVPSYNIINKVHDNINGKDVLQQVTILEYNRSASASGYSTVTKPAYRVLKINGNEIVYHLYLDGDVIENGVIKIAGQRMASIPLVPVYASKERYFVGSSIFEDLAHYNIKHYNLLSEFHKELRTKGGSTGVLTGELKDSKVNTVEVGSDKLVHLEEGSELKFLNGAGELQPVIDEIVRIEGIMAKLSLEVQTKKDMTATEIMTDKNNVEAKLNNIVSNVETSIKQVLQIMGEFLNIKYDGEVIINRDFDLTVMSVEDANLLDNRRALGLINHKTWFDENKTGERLQTVTTYEDLVESLDEIDDL